jgi:glucose/arabinose dehydrogenase
MGLKKLATSVARLARHASMLYVALAIVASLACAQSTKNGKEPPPSPAANVLGHHQITLTDLPPPDVRMGPNNFSKVIPKPDDARLTLPPGFEITTYAEGNLDRPRWLALAPNGDVFVAESEGKRITILRDSNGDGKVDQRFVFAEGLNAPFGMAFWHDYLYVGNNNAVIRFKYQSGQTKAEGAPEKIADLPGNGYREHWTRNLIFSPDGSKLYVTVGSKSNVDAGEEPMRAAISEFNPDGSGQRIYAAGTRNPIGLSYNPRTKQLWAAVQERDLIGNDLVPDYVTSITDSAFYGWPYAYIGPHEDPRRAGEKPDLVKKTIVPDVLIQAHSAVLGLTFYEGSMFPAEYRGDAFVALHGSWNRSPRTGYKIVRIRFDQSGKPVGGYDDFLTGWMLGEDKPEVWGRPVGLLVMKDGSLLIADDGAMKIWRVTYGKK